MTWTRQTVFRRATASDIPAIMEIERQPGYEKLVARWSKSEHLANIATPGYLYLVHDDTEGRPIAFAALSGLGTAAGVVQLNRIIVSKPGHGTGTLFLKTVMAAIFDGAPTERLYLRVLPDNHRALALYRANGFCEEATLRRAGRRADGVIVDLLQMSISRDDWEARASRSDPLA